MGKLLILAEVLTEVGNLEWEVEEKDDIYELWPQDKWHTRNHNSSTISSIVLFLKLQLATRISELVIKESGSKYFKGRNVMMYISICVYL